MANNNKNASKPNTNPNQFTYTQFDQFKPLLFSIAYRMLGTVTDAEDVLQETFIKWQAVEETAVTNPKYYLTTITTRLCLNQLNSAKSQREEYVGAWLPEPIMTQPTNSNLPAEQTLLHENISIAFLTLLESLTPLERVIFLLHELFDYKFREIGEIVEKSEANCRQIFRRAKQHMVNNRPRFNTSPAEIEQLLASFIHTVETGDIDAFLTMLAEDVNLVPDGGGQRGAAIHILKGRESVSAFILGTQKIAPPNLRYQLTHLNGQLAILATTEEGRPFFALFVYGDKQSVQMLYVIAGKKLRHLANDTDLLNPPNPHK